MSYAENYRMGAEGTSEKNGSARFVAFLLPFAMASCLYRWAARSFPSLAEAIAAVSAAFDFRSRISALSFGSEAEAVRVIERLHRPIERLRVVFVCQIAPRAICLKKSLMAGMNAGVHCADSRSSGDIAS
jgi:hypothetical protein